jgi:hypothetical protein
VPWYPSYCQAEVLSILLLQLLHSANDPVDQMVAWPWGMASCHMSDMECTMTGASVMISLILLRYDAPPLASLISASSLHIDLVISGLECFLSDVAVQMLSFGMLILELPLLWDSWRGLSM